MRYPFPSEMATKYEVKIVGLWKILETSSFPYLNNIYSKNLLIPICLCSIDNFSFNTPVLFMRSYLFYCIIYSIIYCERSELILHVYGENKQDLKPSKIIVERSDWYQNSSFFM